MSRHCASAADSGPTLWASVVLGSPGWLTLHPRTSVAGPRLGPASGAVAGLPVEERADGRPRGQVGPPREDARVTGVSVPSPETRPGRRPLPQGHTQVPPQGGWGGPSQHGTPSPSRHRLAVCWRPHPGDVVPGTQVPVGPCVSCCWDPHDPSWESDMNVKKRIPNKKDKSETFMEQKQSL